MRRFQNRNYELEDLYQIGCMGFIKSVQNFNIQLGNQLSTYATYMIIGEIKRFLRDNGPLKVSRNLKEIGSKIKNLQEEMLSKRGEELTIDEISKILKLDKEEIVMAMDSSLPLFSMDSTIDEENQCTMGEKLASSTNEYEKVINKMFVNDVMKYLNAIEKTIIVYRYYREKTQSQVAQLLGTSQTQISRIEKKALLKMRNCS